MNSYDLLRQRCGLSQREAAEFHGVAIDSVKKWCAGTRQPAPGLLAELRDLYARIERAAAKAVITIRKAPTADAVELGYAADDHEARALGWPCVGAQGAMIGLVLTRLAQPVRLVPRGSTLATAAAIAAHEPP